MVSAFFTPDYILRIFPARQAFQVGSNATAFEYCREFVFGQPDKPLFANGNGVIPINLFVRLCFFVVRFIPSASIDMRDLMCRR